MQNYVYHWTTLENAEIIEKEGLKDGSWVCKKKYDWAGEVCFAVRVKTYWNIPGKCKWQRRMWKGIPASDLTRIKQCGILTK